MAGGGIRNGEVLQTEKRSEEQKQRETEVAKEGGGGNAEEDEIYEWEYYYEDAEMKLAEENREKKIEYLLDGQRSREINATL